MLKWRKIGKELTISAGLVTITSILFSSTIREVTLTAILPLVLILLEIKRPMSRYRELPSKYSDHWLHLLGTESVFINILVVSMLTMVAILIVLSVSFRNLSQV